MKRDIKVSAALMAVVFAVASWAVLTFPIVGVKWNTLTAAGLAFVATLLLFAVAYIHESPSEQVIK